MRQLIGDKEQKAYEFVLDVLPKEQYQLLADDEEFIMMVKQWKKRLTLLEQHAPLPLNRQQVIWKKLAASTKLQQTNNKTTVNNTHSVWQHLLDYWRYVVVTSLAFSFGLWLIIPSLYTSHNVGVSEWAFKTDITNQQLTISATTHRHTSTDSACVLWVEHNGSYHLISKLPESGMATIQLNNKLLQLMQQGKMVHSTEKLSRLNDDVPEKPTHIDFVGNW